MRQDRGAACATGVGGDSWRFSRPLRAPPADLPAGRRVPRGFIVPAQPGRPVTGGPTCFGSRVRPVSENSVQEPRDSRGRSGQPESRRFRSSVWKLLRTCAELEKPHQGSRLRAGPWREIGAGYKLSRAHAPRRAVKQENPGWGRVHLAALLISPHSLAFAPAVLKFSPAASGGPQPGYHGAREMPSALRTETGRGFELSCVLNVGVSMSPPGSDHACACTWVQLTANRRSGQCAEGREVYGRRSQFLQGCPPQVAFC